MFSARFEICRATSTRSERSLAPQVMSGTIEMIKCNIKKMPEDQSRKANTGRTDMRAIKQKRADDQRQGAVRGNLWPARNPRLSLNVASLLACLQALIRRTVATACTGREACRSCGPCVAASPISETSQKWMKPVPSGLCRSVSQALTMTRETSWSTLASEVRLKWMLEHRTRVGLASPRAQPTRDTASMLRRTPLAIDILRSHLY